MPTDHQGPTEWNKATGWVIVPHPDGIYVPAEITGYRRGKDFTRSDIVSLAVLLHGAVMTTEVFIPDVLSVNPKPVSSDWLSEWRCPNKDLAGFAANVANAVLARWPELTAHQDPIRDATIFGRGLAADTAAQH